MKNVAQCEQALESPIFVDDDKAMDSRFADGIEDGVEAVVQCTCEDAGEVLCV